MQSCCVPERDRPAVALHRRSAVHALRRRAAGHAHGHMEHHARAAAARAGDAGRRGRMHARRGSSAVGARGSLRIGHLLQRRLLHAAVRSGRPAAGSVHMRRHRMDELRPPAARRPQLLRKLNLRVRHSVRRVQSLVLGLQSAFRPTDESAGVGEGCARWVRSSAQRVRGNGTVRLLLPLTHGNIIQWNRRLQLRSLNSWNRRRSSVQWNRSLRHA